MIITPDGEVFDPDDAPLVVGRMDASGTGALMAAMAAEYAPGSRVEMWDADTGEVVSWFGDLDDLPDS